MAISPDGRTLASGSSDETIRLWEVVTGKERFQFPGQREGVFALAFAPDGRSIASARNDTTILIWDVTGTPSPPPSPKATLKPPLRLMPSQLEQLWQDLGSSDVPKAYGAVWAAVLASKQSVPFLKTRLPQLVPVDRQRIHNLVLELNHDQVTRRDKATQELEKIGALCEPMLRAAVAKPPSPDSRRRLERLLAKIEGPVASPDTLHVLRVLEALELANTAESRQMLESLGRAAPPTKISEEAKAALERLSRRPALA